MGMAYMPHQAGPMPPPPQHAMTWQADPAAQQQAPYGFGAAGPYGGPAWLQQQPGAVPPAPWPPQQPPPPPPPQPQWGYAYGGYR